MLRDVTFLVILLFALEKHHHPMAVGGFLQYQRRSSWLPALSGLH